MARIFTLREAIAFSLPCLFSACAAAASNTEVKIANGPLCSGSVNTGPGIAGTLHGAGKSNVAVSSDQGTDGDIRIYRAGFSPSTWSGSLEKFGLAAGKTSQGMAGGAQWDAGIILTGSGGKQGVAPRPLPAERNIYLGYRGADKSFSTVAFKWANLSAAQKSALNISPQTMKDDGFGQKRVDYLRGDRSLELDKTSGLFRTRDRVLGDIVNSNPVYVGAPSADVPGKDYQEFYERNKDRTKGVYVGANDGMLHGFNAADGSELFAYIPNALVRGLSALSDPAYQHRPFVDGGISVAEAQVAGQWKTVLVAGMGGGAQGVFALDVTKPASFGSGMGAIFEFTDEDDPDMGNVTDAPLVARFRTSAKSGSETYKYFAVVSSGVNNYRNDGKGLFNNDGASALFLLSLDKPAGEPWKLGTNYYKFRTPSKDPSMQNGLAMPVLVAGAGGGVRFAYAGDLQGNLWRFNFTGDAPWKSALGTGEPLFVARDVQGARQPISMQPRVVFAPGGGYVVLFGTGKFLESADTVPSGFMRQSFYGIYDTTEEKYRVSGRTELAIRSVRAANDDQLNFAGTDFEYGTGDGDKKGWYFDFIDSGKTGERAVSHPVVMDGILYFNTLLPAGNPCVSAGTRTYVLKPLAGLPHDDGRTGTLMPVNMSGSPLPVETSLQVGARNPVGRRLVKKIHFILDPGNDTQRNTMPQGGSEVYQVTRQAGRLTWREIVNWQELRHALGKK